MGMRQFKKNVAKNVLKFDPAMYTTLPGSIVITSYILNEEKPSLQEIRKTWRKCTKKGLPFSVEDENYISKVLDVFGMKSFPKNSAAFVCDGAFALVAPFVDGDLYPLREDGVYAHTLQHGKIYPIAEKE